MTRNQEWKEIWEAKGRRDTGELHKIDGYDLLDAAGWHQMIRALVAPIPLRAGMRVTELGCGAGAFLQSLREIEPGLQLTGLDYAESLIATARSRVAGQFFVGDIRDCPALATASAEVVCSFGVMIYLDAEADVSRALNEIDRVAKPGGRIYVGEVSDVAKRDEALRLRESTHANHNRVSAKQLQHLYLSREFFVGEAARLGWRNLRIVAHADLPELAGNALAGYRFSVYAEKAS